MPVALPAPHLTSTQPPDAAEAALLHRGICSAAAAPDGLTPLQQLLLAAVTEAMTGYEIPCEAAVPEPIGAPDFAAALASRNLVFRTRIVQMMLLGALVLRPLPEPVVRRVRDFAEELAVDDDMIAVAQAYAEGALDLAAADFARNGYFAGLDLPRGGDSTALSQPWQLVESDPALAARWQALEELPPGTLGRGVVDFYRDRGFAYPGLPGSAPPLLAQHDWVHVLAGYGSSLEGEVEVFGFIARANDDTRAFSLLAMIISLFETGYLSSGAGLFTANPGHLSTSGMTDRLADALRRGALLEGSHDFMSLDWFAVADQPVSAVRREWGLTAKSAKAVAAGSASAWETGGITPFQLDAARRQAEQQGRPYVPWQPDPQRA